MSCSSAILARRGLLLGFALVLGGCGFRPLYAPHGPRDWDPDLAAIAVVPIADRPGQILELALRETLNPAGVSVPTRWRLVTALTIGRSDLGIQRNATATSSEITVSANYTLYDATSGRPVYSNASRAISDFNQITDAYATQVAADDARDRALEEVAQDMAIRMAVFVRQTRSVSSTR
jgi:LPS-assembly lipoprotein